MSFTYIDLFSGAGGLSEGFSRAGFIPVSHIDIDIDSCYTLKTRLAYYYLNENKKENKYFDYLQGKINRETLYETIPESISKSVLNYGISTQNIGSIFKKTEELIKERNLNNIDVLIGGPPCQSYSHARGSASDEEDERNFLYLEYGKFLKEYRPKLFIFENVPGLYTANEGKYYKNLKKYFRRIGYELNDKVLDAADFGVVQRRKRVIIIGWDKNMEFNYPDFEAEENNRVVNDIFEDLPNLKAGQIKQKAKYKKEESEYLKNSGLRNGLDFITQNITRYHNKKDLAIYKMAIKLWESKKKRITNDKIPGGIRTQNNTESFLDRFKVVAADKLSHTLIAHIAKDGHHYIHPDKKQLRSISVREAARIQSFPDEYYFEGSRTSIFRQIGNAVPPIMAEAIAHKIKEVLNG